MQLWVLLYFKNGVVFSIARNNATKMSVTYVSEQSVTHVSGLYTLGLGRFMAQASFSTGSRSHLLPETHGPGSKYPAQLWRHGHPTNQSDKDGG